MPAYLGEWIVGLVLAAVVLLAVRSLWRAHKSGGHCSGNCAGCTGCSGASCPSARPKKAE